jgi:hypothetical protein
MGACALPCTPVSCLLSWLNLWLAPWYSEYVHQAACTRKPTTNGPAHGHTPAQKKTRSITDIHPPRSRSPEVVFDQQQTSQSSDTTQTQMRLRPALSLHVCTLHSSHSSVTTRLQPPATSCALRNDQPFGDRPHARCQVNCHRTRPRKWVRKVVRHVAIPESAQAWTQCQAICCF